MLTLGLFTSGPKKLKRNVNSVAKTRTNATKKKYGNNLVAKRKASSYLLRGTKKIVVGEIENKNLVSN